MKWPRAPLGKLARMVGGGTPSKGRTEFWGGGIPWVSPKDMSSRALHDAEDHITQEAVEASATQIVPEGSVLIVVRSGILVRRFPIAVAQVPVALNQDMKAIIPGGPLLPQFLAYALESNSSFILQNCVKRGATVHSVDIAKLQNLSLPMPSGTEQRRIVEILDQADAIRKLRAEAEAKAERILPALFLKMFGDPATNPRGWSVRPLGELAVHLTSGSRGWSRNTGRGSSYFLRTQDIVGGEIATDLLPLEPPDGAEAERTRLQEGDVVVTITGIVGKAATFRSNDRQVYVSQHIAIVRPDSSQVHPDYLTSYANLPFGNVPLLARLQYGQTKPGLGFRELINSLIPLPPIRNQRDFAAHLGGIRTLKLNYACAGRKLSSLWHALLRRAFSGDLTASWRTAHMKELLQEMDLQARALSKATA